MSKPNRKRGVGEMSSPTSISKNEIDEVFAELESMPALGGKRRRQMGGGCDAVTRQRVRIIVLASLAGGAYLGGASMAASAATSTAAGASALLKTGFEAIKSSECAIGPGKAAIQNLLCMKYGELLEGINTLITTTKGSAGLQTLGTFIGGLTAASMYSSFKDLTLGAYNKLKGAGSGATSAFEYVVDQICNTLRDGGVEAAAQTDAMATRSMAESGVSVGAEASGSAAGPPKGGRRKRTMKKRKGVKRSTRKLSFRY